MDVQRNFEVNVEKRSRDIYGPTMGKRLLIFIDDMNIPKVPAPKSLLNMFFINLVMKLVWSSYFTAQVDTYGTQQPIAFLKLLLDRGGLYDRGKELNYKFLKDLIFIAAMGKAGGGRNEVDPRFISLFSVFSSPFPTMESLHLIYASIIKGHTKVSYCLTHKISCCYFITNLMFFVFFFSCLRQVLGWCVIQSQNAP